MEVEGEEEIVEDEVQDKGIQETRTKENEIKRKQEAMAKRNQNTEREIYVNEDGVLKHIIDVSKLKNRLVFDENFGSRYKVTITITITMPSARAESGIGPPGNRCRGMGAK